MLIKITESCHGYCTHCMNNSLPCDRHMNMSTLLDVLDFTSKYDVYEVGDTFTGGEPTENPEFIDFVHKYFELRPSNSRLTITSNGHWLLENPEITHDLLDKYPNLIFQVTYDNRYYPNKLDITKRALRHKRILIETNIRQIYPQGRAKTNNLPYNTNCPHCINVQLIMLQLKMRNPSSGLKDLFKTLRLVAQKFCVPAIHYDGKIGLGESDLCPTQCSIYDTEDKIISCILNHDCHGCPEALESLAKNGLNHLKGL